MQLVSRRGLRRSETGQVTAEYVLFISVIVIALWYVISQFVYPMMHESHTTFNKQLAAEIEQGKQGETGDGKR